MERTQKAMKVSLKAEKLVGLSENYHHVLAGMKLQIPANSQAGFINERKAKPLKFSVNESNHW